MSTALDSLLNTTFTTRAVAEEALDKCAGDVPKARKALARRKGAPLDPALGARLQRLHAAAKAEGAHKSPDAGLLQILSLDIPRDFSALLFISTHWRLSKLDFAGARLEPSSVTARAPELRSTSREAYPLGQLKSGARLVLRFSYQSDASWAAVSDGGQEEHFSGLDAILERIETEAGQLLGPAPLATQTAGPPVPCPGESIRVYVGARLLECDVPSADLYGRGIVQVRPHKKQKLPADDMWLVSREGQLYRLTLVTPGAGKRAHVYAVTAVAD